MTTLVRGPIKLVTDRPDTVRKVSIRAPELRLHGAGIVTGHSDDIPVVGGQVEFEALPGPAVLTLVTAGGAPLRSVDIVVPDEDTATLSECLDQIYVYDPPVVGRAQQFAREAGEHADRAEAGAARVGSAEQVGQWVGEAEVLHDDTVAAANHADTQAGIATEQAGVAAGHAEQAGEDRVQTADDRRQTGEDRAQTGEDREASEQWAGQSKDAAALAITSAAIGVEGYSWEKGQITSETDLNDVTAPGVYEIRHYTVANSLKNRPTAPYTVDRSALEVLVTGGGAVHQTWTPMRRADLEAPIMHRRSDTDGTWTSWVRLDDISPEKESYLLDEIVASHWIRRDLVTAEDLDDLLESGIYRVPTYARANTLLNKPTSARAVNAAILEVKTLERGDAEQVWTTMGSASNDSPVMRRRRGDDGVWGDWERIDNPLSDALLPVGMMAAAGEGEARGLRTVLRGLSPDPDPVWSWWAPPATELLTIPTHDGSGQTCHPSVLYFPGGWNGWKYWMAHTPYPNFNERHEDPNIAVSDDGDTWQVPEGLTNPLDDAAGRPDPHNSDAHLAMWGDTMVLTWRMVDRPNSGQNIIYARTSTDGVTWTPKVEVLKVPLGTSESTFVSQALVKMPTGWRMYGVHSVPAPNVLSYYETSVDDRVPLTADWGPAITCDIGPVATGRDPWHVEVQRLAADDWVMVMSDGRRGTTGVAGDIFLGRSTDGDTWDVSPLPLTSRGSHVLDHLYKTGFVVSGAGVSRTLDLFVSGYRSDERTWGVYRTQAAARLGPIKAPTLADVDQRVTAVEARNLSGTGSPEGKIAAPVGATYVDELATAGAVRWIKTTGTGNTGWQVEYGDTGSRDVSAFLLGDAEGNVYIQRTESGVSITGTSIRPRATGIVPLLYLPEGFRALRTTVGSAVEGTTYRPIYALHYSPYLLELRGITSPDSWVNFNITITPAGLWPTLQPGTPS